MLPELKTWRTGAALRMLKGHTGYVRSVAFSPDGKVVPWDNPERLLGPATRDKTVRLWDAATGATLQKLKGHTDGVLSVAFSPDGKVLASASRRCEDVIVRRINFPF